MKKIGEALYLIFAIATGIIGYQITGHDFALAVVSAIFAPIAWSYWLITHQVNISVLKESFGFFFN